MSKEPVTTVLDGADSHPPLAEDAAAELVTAWAAKGFFRLRNMGDKIFFEAIARGVAYTIRVQTHYEHRIVRRTSVPYHGGSVDDRGLAPAPWQINVPRPAPFEERTEVVVVPHTDRVQMCPKCAGQGRVTCNGCAGQGRTVCLWCHGRGTVSQQVMVPSRDAAGSNTMIAQQVERPCICSSGMVLCSICHGNKILRCETCDGSGSVKMFDQLVVRFQTASQGELLDVTPVPDKWLAERTGELLLDQRKPRIDELPALPESAARKAEELLKKSHEVDERDYRTILQHLRVERIPIHEVRYKYAGQERKLWICGNEQDVYAPKAPWNRARFFGLVAAGSVAVAAIVAGVLWFAK